MAEDFVGWSVAAELAGEDGDFGDHHGAGFELGELLECAGQPAGAFRQTANAPQREVRVKSAGFDAKAELREPLVSAACSAMS